MRSWAIKGERFILPQVEVDRLETSLNRQQYVVTVAGTGKRFMVSSKLADLIIKLKEDKPLDEIAESLSEAWGQSLSPDDLRLVIKEQMAPRGLALRLSAAGDTKIDRCLTMPLYKKLLAGHFRWSLIGAETVRRVGTSFSILFESSSLLLALLLIVISRWLLYSTMDWHFYLQVVGQINPVEYIVSLGLLLAIVLFHEVGHASAQIRAGLRPGPIGFQLYYYIPSLFANVDASWSLKPRYRMMIDVGGVYFQCIASSLIYLAYLQTSSIHLLTVVITSDALCLITMNPFVHFDGYWLLSDALAVPNLQKFSRKLLADTWKKIAGQAGGDKVGGLLGGGRAAIILIYAILRNCFFVLASVLIVVNAQRLYGGAAAIFSKLFEGFTGGMRTLEPALALSSLMRMALLMLLLATASTLLASVALGAYRLGRACVTRVIRGGLDRQARRAERRMRNEFV
jgi:putative peptide zinc metalloprotease protein